MRRLEREARDLLQALAELERLAVEAREAGRALEDHHVDGLLELRGRLRKLEREGRLRT